MLRLSKKTDYALMAMKHFASDPRRSRTGIPGWRVPRSCGLLWSLVVLPGEPVRAGEVSVLDTERDAASARGLGVRVFEEKASAIYEIAVDSDHVVRVRMTLTSPGCPAAQSLPVEVVNKLKQLPGITGAHVDIVWDPPWDKDRISDAAKLQLGMF